MSEDADKLFDKALKHAITAGGLGRWAKKDPRLTSGFNKAASKQHERASTALDEWCALRSGPYEGM